jgi:succinate dehydrogenase / fumarate reductase, iron-sulfur subunit
MQLTMTIFRFNPETDVAPHYDTFTVDAEPNDRILDCLNKIRWHQDPTLSFRMSCAHGVCGSDGLTINNKPALACQKLVKDYNYTKTLLVEPLRFFQVVKDLIVDFEPFFNRIKALTPPEQAKNSHAPLEKERLQMPEQRTVFDDALKCILCACCYGACPVINEQDPQFTGPAAVLRAQRYIFDSRTSDAKERLEVLKKPHGALSCKNYYRCTLVCPKNIKVTEAIIKTKKKIQQEKQDQ